MKKIANILVVLMLMVSLASLALADDEAGENHNGEFEGGTQDGENETSDTNETEEPGGNETDGPDGLDNETEEEIGIMNNSLGAEIRLLQLEKAIVKNLLKGERAVEVLKAMGFNTSNLELILAEMRLLLEEVQDADPGSNDSVRVFVDLKIDAKNLTKQFRETVKELLDNEKIKELKERVREIVGDELQNYSKKIRNRIKQFNRNQLHRLYGIIGETNNSLIDEYGNSNVSLDQVKSQICKMVNQMTKEKKYQIFSEVKEDNIRKKIKAQASADEMQNNGKGKGKGKTK
ncbi:MAG: hypothetical protein JSW60_06875 [Thermoplasmatales archaeon]|nr:MAG: hypothetical protein JSW60_06875 [Thermoplasmatales archaeon]